MQCALSGTRQAATCSAISQTKGSFAPIPAISPARSEGFLSRKSHRTTTTMTRPFQSWEDLKSLEGFGGKLVNTFWTLSLVLAMTPDMS